MARASRTARKNYQERLDLDDDLESEIEDKPKKATTSKIAAPKAVHALTGNYRRKRKAAHSDDDDWTGDAASKRRKGKKAIKPIDKIKRGSLSKLMELPLDALVNIFSALEPADIYHLSIVNKELHRFLWRPSATTIYKNIQQSLSFEARPREVTDSWWYANYSDGYDSQEEVAGKPHEPKPDLKLYLMPDPPPDRCWPAYFRDYFVTDVCVNCSQKCHTASNGMARRNLCRTCVFDQKSFAHTVNAQAMVRFGTEFLASIIQLIIRFDHSEVFHYDRDDAFETWQEWLDNGKDETDLGILLEDRAISRKEIADHNLAFFAWKSSRKNYTSYLENARATRKSDARKEFIQKLCDRLLEDDTLEADEQDCQQLQLYLCDKRAKRDWYGNNSGEEITDALYARFRQYVASDLARITQFRKEKNTWRSSDACRKIAQEEFATWKQERKVDDQPVFWPPIADLFGSDTVQAVFQQWLKDHHVCKAKDDDEDVQLSSSSYPYAPDLEFCDPETHSHVLTDEDRAAFRRMVQEAKNDILAAVDQLHDTLKLRVLSLLPGRNNDNLDSDLLSKPQHAFKCAACPKHTSSRLIWPTLFDHTCVHSQYVTRGWQEVLSRVEPSGYAAIMPRRFDTKLLTYDTENYKIFSNISLYLGPEEALKLPQTHADNLKWLNTHRIACLECEESKTNQTMNLVTAVRHCENETTLWDSQGKTISAGVHTKIKVVNYEAPKIDHLPYMSMLVEDWDDY